MKNFLQSACGNVLTFPRFRFTLVLVWVQRTRPVTVQRAGNAPEGKENKTLALSRKTLAAMDIPAEKIDEIISAHVDTINAIKEERDTYKADAEKLPDVEKALEAANEALKKFESGDWESKYNKLKGEYDTYKSDTEAKAVKAAKEAAYTKLLKDAGVAEKRIASILKVTDVDGTIKLDKDGNIADSDKLTESVKTEWADFIVAESKQGADVPKPADNNGGEAKAPNHVAEMVAQYRNAHYGNPVKEG